MISRINKKNIRRLLSFFKVALTRETSLKRKWNYLLCGISSVLGLEKSLGNPLRLTIEPTNACDQKCPICETGNGTLGRTKGFMTTRQFNHIVDQMGDTLEEVFFYFMGEPFLNKDAYKMIRYAADRNIYVNTCTDGNFVKPKELIDSGISEVNFQIGGMSQETHETYRVRGKLEKALKTMEEAIEYKKEVAGKTKIKLGFILMKHNEHELPKFLDYVNKIGVDDYEIIGSCIRKIEEWDKFVPSDEKYQIYDPEEIKKGKIVPKQRPNNYCGELYSATSIQVNGDVVSCCRDPKGSNILGNIFEDNFYDNIWNGQKYSRVRKQVNKYSNKLKLCELCPGEGVVHIRDESEFPNSLEQKNNHPQNLSPISER